MNYYLNVLKKYAVFNGRAQRKEYWVFFLLNAAISLVLSFISGIIGTAIPAILYSLAVLIPGIAVAVRRLHDTNHSGWWFLIGLIPLVGVIILLVFLASDSQSGENQYGPNPKQVLSNNSLSNDIDRAQPPNQELIDYIKTSLAQGYSREDIKRTLVQAGWPLEEIDSTLKHVHL